MTPEQEEQVRRALAAVARADDARAAGEPEPDAGPGAHSGTQPGTHPAADLDAGPDAGGRRHPPLPPDVAARLDTVLGELVAPRVAAAARHDGAASGAGDELARRRRSRWPNALVAAAALCVIALAGGAAATGGFGLAGGSDDSRTAGGVSSDSGPDASAESGADSGAGARSASPSTEPRELAANGVAPTLRTDTLTGDITRLVGRSGRLPTGTPPSWRCVPPPLRAGEQLVGVRLDGRRSSLVLGVPTDGERTARVYSCADPDVLVASTRVPDAGS